MIDAHVAFVARERDWTVLSSDPTIAQIGVLDRIASGNEQGSE